MTVCPHCRHAPDAEVPLIPPCDPDCQEGHDPRCKAYAAALAVEAGLVVMMPPEEPVSFIPRDQVREIAARVVERDAELLARLAEKEEVCGVDCPGSPLTCEAPAGHSDYHTATTNEGRSVTRWGGRYRDHVLTQEPGTPEEWEAFDDLLRTHLPEPPLGLRPRRIAEEARAYEINQAISRYLKAGYPIPPEWVEERTELLARTEETT